MSVCVFFTDSKSITKSFVVAAALIPKGCLWVSALAITFQGHWPKLTETSVEFTDWRALWTRPGGLREASGETGGGTHQYSHFGIVCWLYGPGGWGCTEQQCLGAPRLMHMTISLR